MTGLNQKAGWIAALTLAASAASIAPLSSQTQTRPSTFRSEVKLVRIDVVVRDKDGNVVRGLTGADFLVAEDGKPQQITSFNFEEITTDPLPTSSPAPAVLGLDQLQDALQRSSSVGASTPRPGDATSTVAPEDLAGRRLVVLLFDTSSMQPEEISRAA